MLGNVETSTETVQKVATAMLSIVQDNNWLARENTRLSMESERLQELVTSMEKTIADQLFKNNVRRDTIADLQCRVSELESDLEKIRGMYKALRAADIYRRDLLTDDEKPTLLY